MVALAVGDGAYSDCDVQTCGKAGVPKPLLQECHLTMADRSYEVLYYKRASANKVHRQRGVSSMDGILTIVGERVTLKVADRDDSSSDEEENSKHWNKKRRGKTPSSVYSGTQREIAKRSLNVDDTIVLGGFEVQIGRSLHITATVSNDAKNAQIPCKKPTKSIVKKPLGGSNLLGKRKLVPTGLKSRVVTKRAVAPLQSTHSIKPHPSKPIQRTQNAARPTGDITPTKNSTVTTILPHIPLAASIRAVLRPHQIVGVEFLWKTLHETNGCILGDEMGLGKTLMTIATLAAMHRQQRHKQFIVVCPSSLIVNWANEFDKWLGKASQPKRIVIRKGGQEGLSQIRAYTSSMKMNLKHHVGQVLIVSYDLFRRNVKEFAFPEHTSIGLLVCDESHRLKSSTGSQTLSALQALQADARLCITATPIQNNLSEFYNLANFCCPGILGPDLSSFRSTFERPIAAANQKNASSSVMAAGRAKSKELEVLSKTFMLRRLQRDVLKSMLPPRVEVLLFCRLSAKQSQLYHELTNGAATDMANSEALQTLTALRKVCCHPSLLKKDETDGASGKIAILCLLLRQIREKAPNDKVVVVSNFTSALTVIEDLVLKPNKMEYMRLDGTSKDRQSMVDSFNRSRPDQSFCFLLSSKAGGCGLNLVGANRLVMFDADWNPSSDIQAMGRVYRQGQTKPCTIYRMFSTGTLEEVIYQRQTLKGGLSSLTVDSATTAHDAKFSKDEIKDCFTLKDNCRCDTKNKVGVRWPDYTGVDSIDCDDPPLLGTANASGDTLSFIHVVDESNEAILPHESELVSVFDKTCKEGQDSSSEEEFEHDCSPPKKPTSFDSSSEEEFML